MFSMKYTSPKVTPKKGSAAPTPTPTPSSLDRTSTTSAAAHKRSKSEGHALPSADSLRGNYGGNNNAGVDDILLDLKASESITNNGASSTVESMTDNEPLEPSAVEAGGQQEQQQHLTQDKLIANNNNNNNSNNNNHELNIHYASSILSENDSAVANVSSELLSMGGGGPKSNLLALLDKEYNNVVTNNNNNSSCGEKKSIAFLVGADQQQEEVVGDKENEAQSECNEQAAVVDDEVDFDQTNDTTEQKEVDDDVDFDDHHNDHHNNQDASSPSGQDSCLHHSTAKSAEEEDQQQQSSPSIKLLPKGLSLHETTSGSYEYRRTTSMEPLLFDAQREDSARTTATTSSSSSSIKEENGCFGSFENNNGGVTNQQIQSEATKTDDGEQDVQCTDPTLPIVYDMSKEQPTSPLMSVINSGNEESLPSAGGEILSNPNSMASSPAVTEATISEIGGDTYFDNKPAIHLTKKTGISGDDDGMDDLVHVTLPPRVNRTTMNNTKESTTPPFLPNCPIPAQQEVIPGPIPMKRQKNPLPFSSPRQPLFSHTHSLLDDCSEDEEEESNNTSYTIVDSPTRHMNPSYGCIPRQRSNSDVSSSSPFSLYFNKKGGQQKKKRTNSSSRNAPNQSNQVPGTNANKVASNNIQQALLQTRHRRWDCQSAYAGSHAQSNQMFDISNRVHYYLVGYNNHVISSVNNKDGPMMANAARLSVSVEAVRAAALASGLWRTVRLVKLPKGLFWSYYSTSTNNSNMDHDTTPQQQQHRDDNNDEVWSLLKMLHFTFPSLEQIDFAGDIISRAIMNGNNNNDKIAKNDGDDRDDDDWRDELLTCIMECLPNIIAIDGYVIEQQEVVSGGGDFCGEKVPMSPDPGGHQKDGSVITQNKNNNSPGEDDEESKAARVAETSIACVNCEEVPMCGLDFGADGAVQISTDDANTPNNEGTPATTNRHSSENVVTTSTKAHNDSEAMAIEGSLSHDQSMEDMRKVPLLSSSSSMLSSSSRSWESNGSGRTRPPRPNSAGTRQRSRIPSKPSDQKKSKGSKFAGASGRLKRQVLGLIPTVSMMDEEEDEEEDSDDSEDIVEEGECPSDIL